MFPAAALPRKIGDYAVLRRARMEGTTEVLVAREEGPLGFAREVTLRCVRRDGDDAAQAAELAREAKICARLEHPAIVRVLGLFTEGQRVVLVLDDAGGVTLAELLEALAARGERLPVHAASYVAATVASALAAAHGLHDEAGNATPVLHRAISPEVVHVSRDGVVRLGGFGLAKILDRTPDSVAGAVRGRAAYLAPEQVRGEAATERSDAFSLGVLCFRLFAGEEGASALSVLGGRPPSLASVRRDVPREVSAAVDAALQEDPNKRTITCAELARWISQIAQIDDGKRALRTLVATLPLPEPEPVAAAERPSRRRVRAMERRSSRGQLLRSLAESGEVEVASDEEQPVSDGALVVSDESEPAAAPAAPERIAVESVSMPGPRAATLIGVGGDAPFPARVPTPALHARPRSSADFAPPAAPEAPPAVAAAPPTAAPPIVAPPPAPVVQPPPSPPPAPVMMPASTTPSFSRELDEEPPRRRRGLFIAIGASALVLLLAIVVLATRKKEKPEPATETASSEQPTKTPPSATTSAAPTSEPPAEKPTPTATATANAPLPVPSTKLPKDFGWLFVHSAVPGRVFVAGRGRGEPEKLLAVPCGKLYVNLAKVDAKGNWRGWASKGKTANIPCDGKVGEVTLE